MAYLPLPTSIRHPRESGDPGFPAPYGLPLARE